MRSVSMLRFSGCLLLISSIIWFFSIHNHNLATYNVGSKVSKVSRLPQPITNQAHGRILYLAPSYTFQQYLSLWKSLESWKDICECGWVVDISLQVSNGWTLQHPMITDMLPSLYCHRTAKILNITINQFRDIGFGLNSKHRAIIKERLLEYDYFVFAEEDMLFTIHHLHSYLLGMEQLKRLFTDKWKEFTVGFLRFEERNESLSRVTWEYFPQHVIFIDIITSLFQLLKPMLIRCM